MVFVIERWYRTDATTDALMMQAKAIAIAAVLMDMFFFMCVFLSFAPSVKLTMHVSMCFGHHLTIAVQNRRLSANGLKTLSIFKRKNRKGRSEQTSNEAVRSRKNE
jgi:hypothetical protein